MTRTLTFAVDDFLCPDKGDFFLHLVKKSEVTRFATCRFLRILLKESEEK